MHTTWTCVHTCTETYTASPSPWFMYICTLMSSIMIDLSIILELASAPHRYCGGICCRPCIVVAHAPYTCTHASTAAASRKVPGRAGRRIEPRRHPCRIAREGTYALNTPVHACHLGFVRAVVCSRRRTLVMDLGRAYGSSVAVASCATVDRGCAVMRTASDVVVLYTYCTQRS